MADKAEQARQLFLSGANCAQAVLGAFHRECGLDFDAAMRLASGFGGGWFWREGAADTVFTPEELLDCYIRSVGVIVRKRLKN